MAKASFTKLDAHFHQEIKNITFNEQEIEVKQNLPISEKIDLVNEVVNNCYTDSGYENPIQTEVYTVLTIIAFYTNINFTEKQKENILKLYDSVIDSGLYDAICVNIPADELSVIKNYITETNKAIYNYHNSFVGVMDATRNDYSNMNIDVETLQKNLADPNNLNLMKDVLEKMG